MLQRLRLSAFRVVGFAALTALALAGFDATCNAAPLPDKLTPLPLPPPRPSCLWPFR